ncbi:MAG: hypothetical protein NTU80_06130 [Verrucomicrobia bacterium]|nr:hypothetical protein [Verrucomicrobiota bacterium]
MRALKISSAKMTIINIINKIKQFVGIALIMAPAAGELNAGVMSVPGFDNWNVNAPKVYMDAPNRRGSIYVRTAPPAGIPVINNIVVNVMAHYRYQSRHFPYATSIRQTRTITFQFNNLIINPVQEQFLRVPGRDDEDIIVMPNYIFQRVRLNLQRGVGYNAMPPLVRSLTAEQAIAVDTLRIVRLWETRDGELRRLHTIPDFIFNNNGSLFKPFPFPLK